MRKTLTYTVTDSGRDQGKTFLITEMSAADAEDWALRAFFALMNSGIDIPDEVADMGFAGIATVGLKALGKVEYAKAKPLFDDMMTCVQVVPDPGKPNVVRQLDRYRHRRSNDPAETEIGGVQTAHRFFSRRRPVDYGPEQDGPGGLIEYRNVPKLIGAALSHKVATLRELQEYYSLEDVYNMLEVINVDIYNQNLLIKKDSK